MNLVTLQQQIPGDSKTTTHGYDQMNRLQSLNINGNQYSLTRDTLGRVVQNSQQHPGLDFLYNSASRPYQPTELSGASLSYPFQYNLNKEIVSAVNRTFTYNAIGDLVRVQSTNGDSVTFERSVLGNHLRAIHNQSGLITTTTKIGAGLYELVQNTGGSTSAGRVFVIGEKTAGEVGTIAVIDFTPPSGAPLPPRGGGTTGGTPAKPKPLDPDGGSEDPICGNKKVEQGEECDDGNTTDGDGCSASCKWEESVPGTPPGYPKPGPTPPGNPPPPTSGTTQTGPNGETPTDEGGQPTVSTIPDKKLQTESTDASNKEYTTLSIKEEGPCDEVTDTITHINIEHDLPTSINDTSATYSTLITGTLSSGETVVLGYGFFHGGDRSTTVFFNGANGEVTDSVTYDDSGKKLPYPDPSDLWRMPDWYMEWLSQNQDARSYYRTLDFQNRMASIPQRRYGALPLVTDQYFSVTGMFAIGIGFPTVTAGSILLPGPEELILSAAARVVTTGVATGARVCTAAPRALVREYRIRRVARTFSGDDLCLGLMGEFNGSFARYASNLKGLSNFEKTVLYPNSWMNRTHLMFREAAEQSIERGGMLRFNLNRMDLSFEKFGNSLTTRELKYILGNEKLQSNTVFYLEGKPYSCFSDAKAAWSPGH